VDHIQSKEQRDLRRTFFNGDLLEGVELLRVIEPQHRAGSALPDNFLWLWTREERRARNLGELPDLFRQAHACQNGFNTPSDLFFR